MARSLKFFVTAGVLAAAVLLPSGVNAGEPTTLTVVKVVEGDVPTDAEFVINVECTLTDVVDLTFGPEGGSETINVVPDEDCVVTETEDAGAESVTYAAECSAANGCTAGEDTDSGATFTFFDGGAAGTATVTNTFPEAPPEPPVADVVELGPTFTG